MELEGVIVAVEKFTSKQTNKERAVIKVLSADNETGALGVLRIFPEDAQIREIDKNPSDWAVGKCVTVEAEEVQKGFSKFVNTTGVYPSTKTARLVIE